MFPKIISIGDFFLPTYGVLVAIAFLSGLWVTVRLARRVNLPPEPITNLAIYCALAGLLGAKLMMILFDWSFYVQNPREIFSMATLQAAGVFHGGLLLAIVVAILYMRKHALPILPTMDVFAPGIALGHAIGRLGCFAAGCCWGAECDRPWAVTFTNPEANRLVGVPLGVPLHPTQIYEAIAELAVFAFLYRWFSKEHRAGQIIGLYLILSSAARFAIEFFRVHEQAKPFGGPLWQTQWIALALLAAGVVLYFNAARPRVAPDLVPARSSRRSS